MKMVQAYRFARLGFPKFKKRGKCRDSFRLSGLLSLAASGADSLNACGAPVRPGPRAGRAAMKQEPGTANAGQTGTAAHQAAAA